MRGRVDLSESGESVIERLRRQSHAAQQVVAQPDKPVRMILVGFSQPFKCLLFVAQTGIDRCDVEGRDVSLCRVPLPFFQDLPRPVPLARHRINMPERAYN